jgi:hypothetical protein
MSSIQKNMRRMRRYASDLDIDDVLDLIGLQRRRSLWAYVLPAAGLVCAGVLVGAGIGLMFAPAPGKTIRREAGSKVNELKERIRPGGRAEEVTASTP